MYPTIFEIGSFKVHSYGVMLIVAFFAAAWMGRRRATSFGFTPDQVSDAGFWTLLSGILGARVVFILLSLDHYLKNPDQLWSLRFQGLTSFGGLIFGFLYLLAWAKIKRQSLMAMLDLLSAPVLLAHAIGRIGCLLNGCCHGPQCTDGGWWCVAVPDRAGLFLPAQLFDTLMCLAACYAIVLFERRGLARGQSFSLFVILYGASRFVYEFWRAGASSDLLSVVPLTLAQVTAVAMVVLGIAMYVWFGKRKLDGDREAMAA